MVDTVVQQVSEPRPLALAVRRAQANLWNGLNWAWLDTVCQYRRSRIGPLWETINVLVMLLGMSVVSAAVFGSSVSDIIAYVGLGIIIWSALSALVIEGAGTDPQIPSADFRLDRFAEGKPLISRHPYAGAGEMR